MYVGYCFIENEDTCRQIDIATLAIPCYFYVSRAPRFAGTLM